MSRRSAPTPARPIVLGAFALFLTGLLLLGMLPLRWLAQSVG